MSYLRKVSLDLVFYPVNFYSKSVYQQLGLIFNKVF